LHPPGRDGPDGRGGTCCATCMARPAAARRSVTCAGSRKLERPARPLTADHVIPEPKAAACTRCGRRTAPAIAVAVTTPDSPEGPGERRRSTRATRRALQPCDPRECRLEGSVTTA